MTGGSIAGLGQLLGQLASKRSEQIIEAHEAIGQLRDRDAKQPAGIEQIEIELIAGLLAEVAAGHRPIPQPRGKGADPLASDLDVRAEREPGGYTEFVRKLA